MQASETRGGGQSEAKVRSSPTGDTTVCDMIALLIGRTWLWLGWRFFFRLSLEQLLTVITGRILEPCVESRLWIELERKKGRNLV